MRPGRTRVYASRVGGSRIDMLGAGDLIGGYRITRKLGVGGGGIVYEGEDIGRADRRRTALKFLTDELADDPDAIRRLRREAETLGALSHPNICAVFGIDQHRGRPFIAMQSVPGMTLKAHIAAKHPMDASEVVRISADVTRALDAAHAQGVVHRDIKPTNIMVGEDGVVTVLDFGLARRFRREDAQVDLLGSTIPGRPIGTANYMAPERILQLPLDPRGDLFSLGVVMYEMATGHLPFAGESPYETVVNVLERPAEPISTLAPGHPKRLGQIIERLLAKQAGARFQSATDVLRALEPLMQPRNSRSAISRLRTLFR